MKYNLKEMLRDADLRGYAVPAFNFSDCWELKAILEAANELNAPVICASNMQTVDTHTPDLLGAIAKHYISQAATPRSCMMGLRLHLLKTSKIPAL